MFVNFYIWSSVDLFLDLFVSKKNQIKLYNALKQRQKEGDFNV